MATIVAAAGGGNWTAGATWVGGVAPTAADDAQIPSTAGNITIDSGAVCRSADFSTYTGTLTHTAGVTWTIGDATAGLGNIALKLVSGMTYTLGSVTTSAISFISTSATVQTVDFASKTTGNVTFNATSNGSWKLTGGHTVGATATVTLTKGTLDVNGQTVSWGIFSSSNTNTRSLTLGAASITITGASTTVWELTTTTGLTLSAASSTITCNGASAVFAGGASKTYGTVNLTGSGAAQLNSSGVTYANFNRTGTAAKGDSVAFAANCTVTGTFTLAGNSSTNRLLVQSTTVGTQRTITNTGATMPWSNVDLMDIGLSTAYDASAITGNSGDCGGNSNITFTAAVAQTWSGTSGGNWSANAWTTRVPLPQDDVTIASAFTASQTITSDMPRLGKSISWVGSTGNPTWNFGSISNSIFGSETLISGMTISGAFGTTSYRGRGSFVLTSAGKQHTSAISITAPGGTYTLADAFSTVNGFTLSNGTFDTGGFNVTSLTMVSSSSNTRALTLGSSTWNLTSTSATTVWNIGTATNMTFSGTSSTIAITGASASDRIFAGGGLTYGTIQYTVAGSTGALTFTGANTLGLSFSDASNARTVVFPAGVTTGISSWNVNGTAGKLMSITSSTPGTAATLSKASGTVISDYLSVRDSAATGGATWYAGGNSTDVSGNSGWIFTGEPQTVAAVIATAIASMNAPTVSAEASLLASIASASASMMVPFVGVGTVVAVPVMTANASMLAPTVQGGLGAGGKPGRRPPPWPPWSNSHGRQYDPVEVS